MKMILASASPRRQMLLEQIGIPFEVIVDDTPEEMEVYANPRELVVNNAVKKALNVKNRVSGASVIIAADTIVWLDGVIMGKPRDETEAMDMLRRLSGRRHEVYTGVCLIPQGLPADTDTAGCEQISFVESASVFIHEMTDEEIERYVKTGEPMDKAGAYAIQGLGAVFVDGITGDYYTVMGLPLAKVYRELVKFGIRIGEDDSHGV